LEYCLDCSLVRRGIQNLIAGAIKKEKKERGKNDLVNETNCFIICEHRNPPLMKKLKYETTV